MLYGSLIFDIILFVKRGLSTGYGVSMKPAARSANRYSSTATITFITGINRNKLANRISKNSEGAISEMRIAPLLLIPEIVPFCSISSIII